MQMGHAAAEAVVAAGLNLVPYTLTGYSAGVAVSNVGIRGIPVELVGRDRRQEVMQQILHKHPNLIVVDYTTPYCVNGETAALVTARQAVAGMHGNETAPAAAATLYVEVHCHCSIDAAVQGTESLAGVLHWLCHPVSALNTCPVLPACMQTMPSSMQTTVCPL
jgi:hypothetical protein